MISQNRFNYTDIIDMRDLILDIEKLFDDDYERFLQAYECVSKNIDTLPAPKTDKWIVEELLYYFNRPAFTTDFKYECCLEDFEKAITETISNINIGRRNNETGQYSFAISDLNSQLLKKEFNRIVDGLNMLRKLYLTMMDKKYAFKVGTDKEKVYYTDCEEIFCRAMNDARSIILHEINKIAKREKIGWDIVPSYYKDSFYHSPVIGSNTDDLTKTLQRVYEVYTLMR